MPEQVHHHHLRPVENIRQAKTGSTPDRAELTRKALSGSERNRKPTNRSEIRKPGSWYLGNMAYPLEFHLL
jgi:hypothetical protein